MKRLGIALLACLLFAPLSHAQLLVGVFNTVTYATAAKPTFSPVAGAVTNPTTVTASTATSGCGPYIYFDTNSTPTTNQTTYSVTTAVTLYAQARGCSTHNDSAVASAAYTIIPPLYLRGTNMVAFPDVTSKTITWPSGAAAGDFCVVQTGGHIYNATGFSSTSGSWSVLDLVVTDSWAALATYSYTLQSSDISAGYGTLSFSSANSGIMSIACTYGGLGTVQSHPTLFTPSGTSPITGPSVTVTAPAIGLYFSVSGGAIYFAATCNRGIQATNSPQNTSSDSGAYGSLYTEALSSSSTYSPVYSTVDGPGFGNQISEVIMQ